MYRQWSLVGGIAGAFKERGGVSDKAGKGILPFPAE